MSLEYQVGFNYFAEWWRVEQVIKEEKERAKNGGRKPVLKGEREAREERGKEREHIQAAYDEYKEKLQVQMAKAFVDKHKREEWFKERYDTAYVEPFKAKVRVYRYSSYREWENQLQNGYYDEFTLEGIYKNESNGAGGIVEKEEGETTAANEVLGVGDLLPCKGGELRDEAALQPTLLIKTIAPTVNREKVEEFCKEHLGEGAGGFKWLSLSDPNPLKKCHRIGWVILHPGDESQPMMIDERGDARDEDTEGGAVKESDTMQTPLSTAHRALEALNGKTVIDEERGNFTCHVGVHEPPSVLRKKALWDLFSAPERIERDLQLAERLVYKLDNEMKEGQEEGFENVDGVTRIEDRVEDLRSKGWLQPPANAPIPTKKKDEAEDLEEGEDEVMDDEEEGLYDEEVDDEDLLVKKKKLDLLIEYLRRVYNFCFFCVFESDSVHELSRKCAGGHLRRPRSSLTTAAKATARATATGQPFPYKKQESGDTDVEGGAVEEKKSKLSAKTQQQLQRAFNWVKTYEDKLLQLLEPETVDLRKLGGKPLEEALEDEMAKFVKQEDESKWRCKVPECTKLFKGQHFWRKHVEKRHEEWLDKLKNDVSSVASPFDVDFLLTKLIQINLVNTYVLDPAHIAPSRSDANSNGHFPMGNHIAATGTPRGFNLANMNFNQANGMPNFQALFNPAIAGGNWDPTLGNDDRHAGGPNRRNGHRFNNRAAGPYDRQQRDGRNPRFAGNNGRLTPPPRGGRGGSGGARFGDGGPGPVQSTQGRSIKSYEDLDAVGSGGNGELNY